MMRNKCVYFFLCLLFLLQISCSDSSENANSLVTMSGYQFSIPNSYLHRKEDKKGEQNVVSINYVEFPGMKSLSRDDIRRMRKSDDNQMVKIMIEAQGVRAKTRVNFLKYIKKEVREGLINDFSAVHYITAEGEIFEYFSYLNDKNQLIILRCYKKEYKPKEFSKVYPMCINTGSLWKDNIYVSYYFRRTLLGEASSIEKKVKSLIDTFEVKGE